MAKICTPSHLLTVSALLDLAGNSVCTIDNHLFLTYANRHFSDFNRETIEAFLMQAGVAPQRRYIRERLRRLEERSAAGRPANTPGRSESQEQR